MIDKNGFRANVAIVLLNANQEVFWGRRVNSESAWQFPQGGIKEGETIEQAMYRELHEELGLLPQHVTVLMQLRPWIYYRLPRHLRRYHSRPLCVGQKQKWYLLQLNASESRIVLDHAEKPEFSDYQWVSIAHAKEHVVGFKQKAYRRALKHFERFLASSDAGEAVNDACS